ncbi:unnamed protein product [Mytilus coruscus]|uniref:Reverse transcriptase RNase H-like domain-containing protein n=1 Tax=Mytilus coruscus TaxID=42192 RepID=A0A6J8BLV7_MYTCO|nr:unnamed protein product [Mytilus coruscus]
MAEQLILLFVTVNIFPETGGKISWELYTKPAVFGKDVQLSCHLTSSDPCCSEYTRKWAKGREYNLAIINGVSLNILKYKESLNSSANISILTIRTFNEHDVDIPYECTYGFNTFSKVLKITEGDFEYHPLEELPINITIYKSYIEANITFEKVYPTPECNATDGVNNMEQNLTVTNVRNGVFYTSNIYLLYDISNSCQRTIVVKCTIGQSSFTVVNNTVPCLKGKWPETVEEAEVRLRSVEANFHYLEKCEKKETEDKIISELKPKIDMMFQQISAVNSKSLQQPIASPTMVEPLLDDRKAKVQHRTRTPRRQRRRNPCYRCDLHPHRIDTGDAAPVRQRFYRQSPAMKTESSKHIKEMLDNNIIEPSQSEWASPVCLIAIGYILGQKDHKGREQVIAYGGRSLRGAEKNYCIRDLEYLALIEGGTANGNADALSRRPYGTEIVTITTATVESSTQTEATFIELDPYASICEITTSPKEKVVNDQRTDENFKDVIKYILDKELPDKTRQARKLLLNPKIIL